MPTLLWLEDREEPVELITDDIPDVIRDGLRGTFILDHTKPRAVGEVGSSAHYRRADMLDLSNLRGRT